MTQSATKDGNLMSQRQSNTSNHQPKLIDKSFKGAQSKDNLHNLTASAAARQGRESFIISGPSQSSELYKNTSSNQEFYNQKMAMGITNISSKAHPAWVKTDKPGQTKTSRLLNRATSASVR